MTAVVIVLVAGSVGVVAYAVWQYVKAMRPDDCDDRPWTGGEWE